MEVMQESALRFQKIRCKPFSPLQLAERLRQFCSKGEYDNLIVGGRNFGKYLIESVSETYHTVTNRGEVVQASIDVSLKEYV